MSDPTNADVQDERVPSWAVTDEMLEAWGFQLQKREHCVGMLMITKGMTHNQAIMAAVARGLVTIQSDPIQPLGDATWASVHGHTVPGIDREMFAFFQSIKRGADAETAGELAEPGDVAEPGRDDEVRLAKVIVSSGRGRVPRRRRR